MTTQTINNGITKETFAIIGDGYNLEGYEKKFDENGNMVYYNNYNTNDDYISEYVYDEFNKVIMENIYISRPYGNYSEERIKKYEYINSGYRILEYQTKIIDDSYTTPLKLSVDGLMTPELQNGLYPRDVDSLLSIEYVEVNEQRKIIYRKHTNLIENKTEITEYLFRNDLLLKETFFDVYNKEIKVSKEIIQEFDENDNIILKKIIEYKNDKPQIIDQEEYKYEKKKDRNFSLNFKTTIKEDEITKISEFDFDWNLIEEILFCNYYDRIIYLNTYLRYKEESIKTITSVGLSNNRHQVLNIKSIHYSR